MNKIFADTSYWVALIDPKDKWHSKALNLSKSLAGLILITQTKFSVKYLLFSIVTALIYVKALHKSSLAFSLMKPTLK